MTTTQPAFVAFHGQQAIKDYYLKTLQTNRANAAVSGGIRWKINGPDWDDMNEGREQATAYIFHNDTDAYGNVEKQMGVPRSVAVLMDQVFNNMSPERKPTWPGQFLRAIPLGADLSRIWPQMALWALLDADLGLMRYAQQPDQRAGIQGAADLFTKLLHGEEVTQQEWLSAQETAQPAYMAATTFAMDANVVMSANMTARYEADGDIAAAVDDAEATHAYNANAAQGAIRGAISACTIATNPLATDGFVYDFLMSGAMAHLFFTLTPNANNVYYDELGDQLLALLATAPVPATQQ